MMNKKYKNAFSLVAPSDESIERIFDMTERKRKISFKPLLVAAIVIIASVGGLFTANAATDGEVFEAIEQSEVVKKLVVYINGQKAELNEDQYEYHTEVGEDGKTIERIEFGVTDEYGDHGFEIAYEISDDGVGIGASGEIPGEFKIIHGEGEDAQELYIPTTALNED